MNNNKNRQDGDPVVFRVYARLRLALVLLVLATAGGCVLASLVRNAMTPLATAIPQPDLRPR